MKRIQLVLAAAFAFATFGCDSGGGEYVKKMEGFAEQACGCKDAACATKVSQESGDWLSKNTALAAKLSASDAEKVGAATTKMADCVTKAAMK